MKSKYKKHFFEGKRTEQKFIDLCTDHGYTCAPSSSKDDIKNHIDCWITKDGEVLSVDVKKSKKISRQDIDIQHEVVWIEFVNVRGNRGWIYGEADFIAFEKDDGFLMVDRKSLVEFCEENVNFKETVYKASDALYKIYTREDRADIISMIKLADLVNTKSFLIKYV